MINFSTWLRSFEPKKPWLIAGKGPSLERLAEYDTNEYHIITLNHAIKNTNALIAHLIDLDVLVDLRNELEANSALVVMPWFPHVNNQSGSKNLLRLAKEDPFIDFLISQDRLLWYNSSLAKEYHPDYPIIDVKFFSFDAVVSLLASSGVSDIKTIGIDGGTTYSQQLAEYNDKTLLSNGRSSFNDQFIAAAQTIEKHTINVSPLGEEKVKVFVGSLADQWLATRLLEFSIRWRTSAGVEVVPLYEANIHIPTPQKPENRPRTPFSFQRFLIPALCDYSGKAIYLDSDMMVFTDIRDLAFRDMKGQPILHAWESQDQKRKPQFSVMLINCEELRWDIKAIVEQLDRDELSYEELMHEMKILPSAGGDIENEWNSLEHFEANKTKLLHYTDMNLQPWLSKKNPLGEIWITELAAAVKLGFITKSELKQQVTEGSVRPTIIYQLKALHLDPQTIPKSVRWIDKLFRPPHKQTTAFWRNKRNKKILGTVSYSLAKLLARQNKK